MLIPVHDYRQLPSTQAAYLVTLTEKATYLYEWTNFGTAPGRPKTDSSKFKNWSDFAGHLNRRALLVDITDICLTYTGSLILDNSRDNYKWGAVRSLHSPETRPLLKLLLDRHLVTSDTLVHWGNWASLKAFHRLGPLGAQLADQPVKLYHGTSSHRWAQIQQTGLQPVQPADRMTRRDRKYKAEAVFFATCPQRASYFARETVLRDKKKIKDKTLTSIILETELQPEDVLLPCPDYLDYRKYAEPSKFSDASAESSLRYFGQVGIQDGLLPGRLRMFELKEYQFDNNGKEHAL